MKASENWAAKLLPGRATAQAQVQAQQSGDLAEPGQEERLFAERIGFLVRAVIDSGKFKAPLLPEVAMRLSDIANDPDASFNNVESVVSKDPPVAARVLSVANSALYTRGTTVTSLRVAIARLGIYQVRDIAFQVVAMTRLFKVPLYADRVRDLFRSSVASGLVCKEICMARGSDLDLAYLCGLLHDVGEAAVLSIVADGARARGEPVPPLSKLRITIDTYHPLVGAWVCSHWKLMDPIIDAVLDHHCPDRTADPAKLAAVVALSDCLLSKAGILTNSSPLEASMEDLLAMLDLDEHDGANLSTFVDGLAADPSTWSEV